MARSLLILTQSTELTLTHAAPKEQGWVSKKNGASGSLGTLLWKKNENDKKNIFCI